MSGIKSKEEWRRDRRNKRKLMISIVFILMVAILVSSIYCINNLLRGNLKTGNHEIEEIKETLSNGIVIQKHYLSPNRYSRPQIKLRKIKGIVIHYTANPGTSAKNNRSYFEGLARTKKTSASSHYIIGLEGEILQCIPLTEIAYASNQRNEDTIAIECCHPSPTGEFNKETYSSLVALVAALCVEYNLKVSDILRHYDVNEVQKPCPLYYVDHEDAWIALKADMMEKVKQIEKVRQNEIVKQMEKVKQNENEE